MLSVAASLRCEIFGPLEPSDGRPHPVGGLLRCADGAPLSEGLVTAMAAALLALSSARTALGSLIWFVLWVLVMVWIYNIAKRKGRHAVGWVILGFFFWLLALLVVALLPSKRVTDSYG
jgi:hypothetical protein